MNRAISLGCCLLVAVGIVQAQEKNYLEHLSDFIENTAVFEWNQEEGRSYFIPQKHLSLSGTWKFFYSETPDGIPAEFYKSDFNDKSWKSISVPSNWEMQGWGDKQFRNMLPPFEVNPPHVPKDYNPTGAYRKTFTLPSSWKGDQVFLRMEKVASASFVWVNGQEVGYNEGAQEPAEYNITKFLKPGKNTIAVHVLKFSDGYYLESQDYWRLAGIFDDVWVYAAPSVRLFDWYVVTDLDDTYTDADLKLQVDIKKYTEAKPSGDYRVKARLFDEDGGLVTEMESPAVRVDKVGKKTVKFSKKVKSPAKWTSETPYLYTLKMALESSDGLIQDSTMTRIGFKETLIKGETFYLNGVPLKVNAINSHMQDPEKGHVKTEEAIRKDFEVLKKFNFNAVRTAHYPPVNKYLDLADKYGIFIIDEAGDEAHATEYLSDDPQYTDMYRERVRQMVLRDRNHPSILFWSAGNESGEGSNISEVVKEGRKYDYTRYWMYGGNAFSHPAEDIIGPRYPTPFELEMEVGLCPDSTDVRPSFMDEYMCAVGNGGGGLEDYWRVVYSHPRTMGGAMWDVGTVGLKERVRALKDSSPYDTPVHIMGSASLVKGLSSKALDLDGHDQWLEVYRQSNVEITGEKLTLALDVYPRNMFGSYITKGDNQFGVEPNGNDKLAFYIYTDRKNTLTVALPENWMNHWHKLICVYDGRTMAVYIDGEKAGEQETTGSIKNLPFPINVGRNAQVYVESDPYICDAMIDNVGIFKEALTPNTNISPEKAALWLDFESETDEVYFYSRGINGLTYGCNWPDHSPQPEMWQMKKTLQPISISWLDVSSGWVELWNRNHFLSSSYCDIRWYLEADGTVIQNGTLDTDVAPLSKATVRIPFKKPQIEDGVEYRLTVSSTLRKDECWAKAGYEVAWDQLELPWHKSTEPVAAPLPSVVMDATLGRYVITGPAFKYAFDAKSGELVSMQYKDSELLKSPLSLNVWRAPLANEQNGWTAATARSLNTKEGFGGQIAMEYYSTGLDSLSHYPISVDAKVISGKALIRVRELCLTSNEGCNGFENIYTYTITGDGQIEINHRLLPQGTMPLWLPRIGLTLTLTKDLANVKWYGRGPQENYPDRKTGYKIGVYSTTVDQMYEPYLIPQDYGLRTDTRYLKMTDSNGAGLMFSMNELFNFNAYPYSTENLTKAIYTYQLRRQDGITLNLDYATSGVGDVAIGILNSYRAYPQAYERVIKIMPVE